MKKSFFIVTGFIFAACATHEARDHDQRLISSLMSEKQTIAQRCYDRILKQNPQLQSGKIVMRADHDSGGHFSHWREMSAFPGSRPIYECIVENAKNWKTAEPRLVGTVDLEWHFKRPETNGLQTEQISEIIFNNETDFESCFEASLSKNPNTSGGKLEFEIQIAADGRATSLNPKQGFEGSESILSCLSEKAKSWKFPSADRPSTAIWTWNFKKNN